MLQAGKHVRVPHTRPHDVGVEDAYINNYLEPLMVDLRRGYIQGLKLSKTALYPEGRLTRLALLCVVCDLPAGRKASGTAAASAHNFCPSCHLTAAHDDRASNKYAR